MLSCSNGDYYCRIQKTIINSFVKYIVIKYFFFFSPLFEATVPIALSSVKLLYAGLGVAVVAPKPVTVQDRVTRI